MNFLVIPSIREHCLKDFMEQWKPHLKDTDLWQNIIVIEDNAEKTFNLNLKHHYSWKEIDEDLKEDGWIISRRDSAIRSYGFLMAYRLGAKYIFTLDDDCYPEPNENLLNHIDKIESTPAWTESILGMRTRGIPYFNLGRLKNVVANMGLWTNVPDYDSIQALYKRETEPFQPTVTDRIIPVGQYFPLCGMNFCFKREVAVLSYFALMGENSPFRRFDDIWFGIIFKKICDHLGFLISVGHPFIHHSRASNPFTNLIKEAPGIQFNEEFWQVIDRISLKGITPQECMNEVGEALISEKNDYLQRLGNAIMVWVRYFS
jgi:reversibly glycosylated polypeptide/UDP-arabinopyranose mutase